MRELELMSIMYDMTDEEYLSYLKNLIENEKIDINIRGKYDCTIGYNLSHHNHINSFKYWIKKGGNFTLKTSSEIGYQDIGKIACGECLDYFQKKMDELENLFFNASINNLEYVKICIEDGFNVNFINHSNAGPLTLLHVSAKHNNVKLAEYLIEKGADVNLLCNDITDEFYDCLLGWGAGHQAVISHNIDILKYLHSKGLSMSQRTHDGNSLLHLSVPGAEYYNDEIFMYIIDNLKDVNMQCNLKRTAGHLIARNRNMDMLKIWVNKGGDLKILDSENRDVAHYCINNAFRKGAEFCKEILNKKDK
jgi:ankyrin repeat protein